MIPRAPHVHDERLLDGYFAERRGEVIDPPLAEHLSDCEECRRRFSELGGFMTGLTLEADAEIDALFPPDRLRSQRHEIMRRLDHVGRAARVISFPARVVGRHIAAASPRIASRWVATAAAAGLFVGVAAGMFFDEGTRWSRSVGQMASSRQPSSPPHATRLATVPQAVGVSAPAVNPDDDFMLDLERSLDRPNARELQPFDALTPHVREVRDVQ